jgi:hypothetical protein
MNAVYVLEGRRLDPKLARGFLPDVDAPIRAEDARRGSGMLRDAILRAKGYPVASSVPTEPPIFEVREVKRGRPRGPAPKVRKRNRKIGRIKSALAAHFGLTVADFKSQSRAWDVSRRRQVAIFLSRKTTSASLNDIGFHFGHRHHTTILHAVREVTKRAGNGDPETIAALHAAYQAGIR